MATKALNVAETTHGPDYPDVAASLTNRAALCRATDRIPAAEELEKRATLVRHINQ